MFLSHDHDSSSVCSRNAVSNALDVMDNKLVLFIPREHEEAMKASLDELLMDVPTIFKSSYKIQLLEGPLTISEEGGDIKCTAGSKLRLEDSVANKSQDASLGAILKDENNKLYMISSPHQLSVHTCHLIEDDPSMYEGFKKSQVGPCIASRYTKRPLQDACLIEIENEELKESVDPFLPGLTEKSTLCGPFSGNNSDLGERYALEDTPQYVGFGTEVMKQGQKPASQKAGLYTTSFAVLKKM